MVRLDVFTLHAFFPLKKFTHIHISVNVRGKKCFSMKSKWCTDVGCYLCKKN